MSKILVTGAAGFVGFHTCKRLLADGHKVVGLDNLNDYYDVNLKQARLDQLTNQPNFEFVKLDLADRSGMEALFACSRPEIVIHLAAQAGVPYAATRRKVREMIAPLGGFFEVYVATSIEVCEQRDRKGLYAKARAGVLKEFTGVSDPYEPPASPELVLDAGRGSVDAEAEQVLRLIRNAGFIL